ncbi:glycosyltransferase family 2 protein [Microbulbifer sp. JTAC008]|uniref:glycosyltransferase family 2 protein n=1 Tax=unclassified Microbulbifer TaxID=2619833 RepID=UPI0040395322
MKFGIAAIFKNEYEYILEWIAYHQLIGVDTFYIADNISDDGSSQLLESLDYLGVIKRVYFPRVGDMGPQVPAYNHILDNYGDEVDLLGFIDADEFIVSTNGMPLKDNLKAFDRIEDAGALALNWRNFGSSGRKFKGEGPVIERFMRASKKDHDFNRHIKTILKPKMTKKMHIHECILHSGRYYNANLEPTVFEDNMEIAPKTAEVTFECLRINHYVVKSRQEHLANKERKGSGAGSSTRRKGEGYFKGHDLNDEEDNTLIDLVPAVNQRVEELRAQVCDKSPYLCRGNAVVNAKPDLIFGWAASEFEGALKLRILINGSEYLVDVNKDRQDVVDRGLSRRLQCGFAFRPPKSLTLKDQVEAYIYGSAVECRVNFLFENVRD